MKYYKVISNKLCYAFEGRYYHENIYSFKLEKGGRVSCQYIADELLTAGELKKHYGVTPENIAQFPFLRPVEIKKTNVHFFFGARFEDGRAVYFNKDGQPFED